MRMDSLSLNHFRLRLSEVEALPQWALLGFLSGLLTAAVILAFRYAITLPLEAGLPDGAESFEQLSPAMRFALPIGGGLIVGLVLWRWPASSGVGITHVLERLSYHQGRMPLGNLLTQFIAGVLMLGSGHSGGREGPAVHLGAGVSSLLGQRLKLPNNSLRTLVGCGTAAAIAASFNTPIAGIIFAMEVVMMEYTVAGFIPVLVAAVTAALAFQLLHGDEVHVLLPPLDLYTLSEVPFILLLGVIIGLMAVVFTRIATFSHRLNDYPIWLRLPLAGLAVGLVAQWMPQVMGIGYDTLTEILTGNSTFELLLLLALAKLAVTAFSVGVGAPIGLIGPSLLIGAAAGGGIGLLGIAAANQPVSEVTLYALLGMGAMMAATLQAPLAALLALLELTLNPNILFPGMLAIITSTLIYRFFTPQGSVFQALLGLRGLDWRRAPLDHFLDKTSVISLMRGHINAPERLTTHAGAEQLAATPGDWILISGEHAHVALARADLALYLLQTGGDEIPKDTPLDLLELPALRRDLATIEIQATLKDALNRMNEHNVDGLCVMSFEGAPRGLLFRDDIEQQFRRSGHL
ncbi:chloride channel protein [Motiliproteus sediminis]|uniref:chloride channel protein n=1 Tax=Motiliproteus sediminis TaxID=1468178 RepID=UPI001AF021C4|nr:chloride channel protein [Motiliproteus sediminis]